MAKTEIKHPDKQVSTGAYSAGVLVDGWLYVSGQGPLDMKTGEVVRGTIEEETRLTLETYLAHWRHVMPKTDGRLLRRLGLPPGPAYRTILTTLRAAWLDGQLETADQERDLLQALVELRGGRG